MNNYQIYELKTVVLIAAGIGMLHCLRWRTMTKAGDIFYSNEKAIPKTAFRWWESIVTVSREVWQSMIEASIIITLASSLSGITGPLKKTKQAMSVVLRKHFWNLHFQYKKITLVKSLELGPYSFLKKKLCSCIITFVFGQNLYDLKKAGMPCYKTMTLQKLEKFFFF